MIPSGTRARASRWTFLLLATVAGCKSAAPRNATRDPDEGKSFVQKITASAGGSLSTGSGRVTLSIPPGALGTDTEIQLAVLPKAADTLGNIYDLAPDGLSFTAPVTLTLAFDGDRGDKLRPVLATDSGGGWTALTD
jgi:hypothetical protein